MTVTDKTKIHYEKQSHTWQAINGEVHNCVTRREALLVALRHDWPGLAAKVDSLVRLHDADGPFVDRLLRACQLVVGGNVHPNGVVTSQSGNGTYTVTFSGIPRRYDCNCPDDRVFDAHLGKVCKHTMAAHLATLLGLELPRRRSRDEALPADFSDGKSLEDFLG